MTVEPIGDSGTSADQNDERPPAAAVEELVGGRRSRPAVIEPGAAGLLQVRADARRTYRQGPHAVAARQQARLADLVAFARTRSKYYANLHRGLPEAVTDLRALPVTGKAELMAHFDEVVTDRRVTLRAVERFVADPSRIGTPFVAGYTVATTSGTTGARGLFLLDRGSRRVASALGGRMVSAWLSRNDGVQMVRRGARIAMVNASGGHFASAAAAAAIRRHWIGRRLVHSFPVDAPIAQLVTGLNDLQPSVLAAYATATLLLASEQDAGRLRIHPALVILSAEGIADHDQRRIAAAFGSAVASSYAATECPFLSFSCPAGWLHVNSDWVVLEPVMADGAPTPPGEPSHTVLVTNLANRIQPIIRYDLGDSLVIRPDSCDCGSPLPAVRVQGRRGDLLRLPSLSGQSVAVSALALSAVLAGTPGIDLAQIVHAAPSVLRVRLRTTEGADPERVWRNALTDLHDVLERQGAKVHLIQAVEPPQPTAGGKYRAVLPFQREPER